MPYLLHSKRRSLDSRLPVSAAVGLKLQALLPMLIRGFRFFADNCMQGRSETRRIAGSQLSNNIK